MKALVKSRPEPGLWLEEVPVPEIGINDVLIRVKKASICGTDVHIYNWDEWAQRTIPVPMVIGHEFVGEIVEVGSNVLDFYPGQLVSGEGHVVCGRCRNCLAGRRHLCAHTSGVGVNRPGRFAEYIALPLTNVWVHTHPIDRGRRLHLRSVRQRRAHRARLPRAGRGCAGHRRRAHRHHGGRRGEPRRRAACRHHRRQSLPAGSGAQNGRHAWPSMSRETSLRRSAEGTRHDGRLRRGPGDVGQRGGVPRHAGEHGARRQDRDAGHSRRARSPSTGTR